MPTVKKNVNLTIRFVESIKSPPKGTAAPDKYWDASIPSFGVFVYGTGRKTWNLVYRVKGDKKTKTKMLGTNPPVTLADAREHAWDIIHDAEMGIEREAKEREEERRKQENEEHEKQKPTFAEMAAEYLERHAKPNKRTWKEDERLIGKELLPAWGDLKAEEIKRRDVIKILDGVMDRGAPIVANRVHALISKIFNWAIGRDLVENNPCFRVKKPGQEKKRDRVLVEDEIRRMWAAFQQQGPLVGTMFILRLLTAQRGGEIASMAWENLDLKNGWWTIPAEISKNGLSHRVPLTAHSLRLLNQLHVMTGNQKWVFPSPSVSGAHISNVNKAAERIKEFAGVENFVPHDLRRTAASYMASLGIGPHVISKILNHVETGVTAVYNRHSYDAEKRAALELWEKKLLEIVGEEPSRVVPEAPVERAAPKPEQPKPSELEGDLPDEVYAMLDGIRKMQR